MGEQIVNDQENQERETRSYHIEIRAEGGEGEMPRLEGTAAVYDKPAEIHTWGGSFIEVIERGFFDDVWNDDVRALFNHDSNYVLGRTKSGTLELKDNEDGLGVIIHPPDTQMGRDTVTSIQRGDVDQMSFAFSVKRGWDEWKENDEGVMVRTLKKGACKELFDVSPVTYPAYPQTSIAVRSALERFEAERAESASHDGGDPGQRPEQVKRTHELRKRKLDLIK